jgi:hypothetical protein
VYPAMYLITVVEQMYSVSCRELITVVEQMYSVSCRVSHYCGGADVQRILPCITLLWWSRCTAYLAMHHSTVVEQMYSVSCHASHYCGGADVQCILPCISFSQY